LKFNSAQAKSSVIMKPVFLSFLYTSLYTSFQIKSFYFETKNCPQNDCYLVSNCDWNIF
jgi:hypothetical protein